MSAAHTAQLWALEHILEAGVDTDVIDEIIPIIPEDLPPRLKSRLSLALLRNALRDGSPVGITHCKLLAKIRHPRDLTDDDPVSKLYAEIFAAVILDAPDWDVFRRHRDELFPEGCPFPLASAETKLVDESRILEFPSRGRHTPTCRVFALRPDQIRDKMRECADALRERLGGTSLDRVVDDAKAGRYHVRAEAPDELVAGLNLPPAWMRASARRRRGDARARDPAHASSRRRSRRGRGLPGAQTDAPHASVCEAQTGPGAAARAPTDRTDEPRRSVRVRVARDGRRGRGGRGGGGGEEDARDAAARGGRGGAVSGDSRDERAVALAQRRRRRRGGSRRESGKIVAGKARARGGGRRVRARGRDADAGGAGGGGGGGAGAEGDFVADVLSGKTRVPASPRPPRPPRSPRPRADPPPRAPRRVPPGASSARRGGRRRRRSANSCRWARRTDTPSAR